MNAPSVSRFQALALFLFVMFCFLVLAWRTEMAAQRIEANTKRIALSQWQGCVGGVAIIEKFNAQQHQLADVESSYLGELTGVARERAEARLMAYRNGFMPVRDCGPRPE